MNLDNTMIIVDTRYAAHMRMKSQVKEIWSIKEARETLGLLAVGAGSGGWQWGPTEGAYGGNSQWSPPYRGLTVGSQWGLAMGVS